jgi:hypothetical protein
MTKKRSARTDRRGKRTAEKGGGRRVRVLLVDDAHPGPGDREEYAWPVSARATVPRDTTPPFPLSKVDLLESLSREDVA